MRVRTLREGLRECGRPSDDPPTWPRPRPGRATGIARASAVALVLALPPAACAHEEPSLQEDQLSEQIALHPDDAALYLHRAELHRSQREWTAGVADLQTASRLDPELAVVDLSLARMLLEADNPQAALPAVDRFLGLHGDHAGARLTRARILVRLGSSKEATDEFTRGIELAKRDGQGGKGAQPDDYLERARVLACEGGAHVDEAIRGLDEGTAALSGAITLQLLAIDLELGQRRWDAALRRLAVLEAAANRKETWIARRADVLARAGRVEESAQAYRAALAAIDALPERLRTTTAATALVARIRASLSEPAGAGAPSAARQLSSRSLLTGSASCPLSSPTM